MVQVKLRLPADLVSEAGLDAGDVSQETAKVIAMELFREGKVSLGRAAELCATPLAAFMEFTAQRGVPPLSYSLEELEADRQTIDKLRT
jgi:predicted HTH domain antitoxin